MDALGIVRFVQIGSNDGTTNDPLHPFVVGRDWTGVCVEPVAGPFSRLRRTYAGMHRVTCLNVAVDARSGRLTLYVIDPVPKGAPAWVDQLASSDRELVLRNAAEVPGLDQYIREVTVESVTPMELLARSGLDGIDLLHVDAEGMDAAVVQAFDLERLRPRMVVFEHRHLPWSELASLLRRLLRVGYVVRMDGYDAVATLVER